MLWFAIGLVALIIGAELLVRGASKLALSFGISPLVVGLTVVSFGTSAPELAVSVQSAWAGQTDIALGNVIGSNIANVLLILGASALVVPMLVHRQVIRQEVPVMIAASLLLWVLAADGAISRFDGFLLAGLLVTYTVFVIRQSRREQAALRGETEPEQPTGWDAWWGAQLGLILAGLVLLVLGSNWLVEAAVAFAKYLGISELVVGLTVVAVGTSLPELATSIMAAIKGERDIAVGNVVGSNIFNILAVLGISGALSPRGIPVSNAALTLDLPVMVAVAVLCVPIFRKHAITRWEGLLFVAYYVIYAGYLVLDSAKHEGLAEYRMVVLTTVLPLTLVTVLVFSFRRGRPGHG
jgi:cation:H+ antiporter